MIKRDPLIDYIADIYRESEEENNIRYAEFLVDNKLSVRRSK